jgi:hypothetical protein
VFVALTSEEALRLSKHSDVTLLAFRIARHFTEQLSDLPSSRDRRHICLGDDADAASAVVHDRDTSDLVLLHGPHHLPNRGCQPVR